MNKDKSQTWQVINHCQGVNVQVNLFTGTFRNCVRYIADHQAALILTKVDDHDHTLRTYTP